MSFKRLRLKANIRRKDVLRDHHQRYPNLYCDLILFIALLILIIIITIFYGS